MQQFYIKLQGILKSAKVSTLPFTLTILKDESGDLSIQSLPLREYFVIVDEYFTTEPTKHKVFKLINGSTWYDKNYSEEAEFNSPEFGIPEINAQIKVAIDAYEASHQISGKSPDTDFSGKIQFVIREADNPNKP